MKRLVFVFAVLATATIGQAETINRIVATVDGQPVTLRELEAYSGQMNDRAAMMYPPGNGRHEPARLSGRPAHEQNDRE